MRTEKQNIERMILDNLIESLINEDFWNLCIELDHNPGDTFQITDILVYYLTKKELSKTEIYYLYEVTNFMEHKYDKWLTEIYMKAVGIIAHNNVGNENYYLNMNEFAQDNLRSLVEISLGLKH